MCFQKREDGPAETFGVRGGKEKGERSTRTLTVCQFARREVLSSLWSVGRPGDNSTTDRISDKYNGGPGFLSINSSVGARSLYKHGAIQNRGTGKWCRREKRPNHSVSDTKFLSGMLCGISQFIFTYSNIVMYA